MTQLSIVYHDINRQLRPLGSSLGHHVQLWVLLRTNGSKDLDLVKRRRFTWPARAEPHPFGKFYYHHWPLLLAQRFLSYPVWLAGDVAKIGKCIQHDSYKR